MSGLACVLFRFVLWTFFALYWSLLRRDICKWITLHGQTNSLARNVNFNHRNFNLLLDRYNFFWVFYKLVREVADMHQPVLMDTNIDKGTESRHIRHDTGQRHAYLQVTDGINAFGKAKKFKFFPWIAARFFKLR